MLVRPRPAVFALFLPHATADAEEQPVVVWSGAVAARGGRLAVGSSAPSVAVGPASGRAGGGDAAEALAVGYGG